MKCNANEHLLSTNIFFPVIHAHSQKRWECILVWVQFGLFHGLFFFCHDHHLPEVLSPFNHLFPPSWLIAVVLQRIFCTSVLISSCPTLLRGLQTLFLGAEESLAPAAPHHPEHACPPQHCQRGLMSAPTCTPASCATVCC